MDMVNYLDKMVDYVLYQVIYLNGITFVFIGNTEDDVFNVKIKIIILMYIVYTDLVNLIPYVTYRNIKVYVRITIYCLSNIVEVENFHLVFVKINVKKMDMGNLIYYDRD